MNVVLPVAGRSLRFPPMGDWLLPCLVLVRQRPLIAWAVEPLAVAPRDVIVVGHERDRALLDRALDSILGREAVRVWTGDTPGTVHTVLRAREHLDGAQEVLIIAPGLVWSADLGRLRASDADAGLVVVAAPWEEAPERRREYTYCRLDPDGAVREVVERPAVPLTWVDIGVYWWREGRRFCECADRALSAGIRSANGFGMASVFNAALRSGVRVRTVRAQTYVNLCDAERAARWEGWGAEGTKDAGHETGAER